MLKKLYRLRREILKKIVPEIIWPKTVDFEGAIVPLRSMPYSFGVKKILFQKNYETSERFLIKDAVKHGDHVLELGGSIGIMAAIMQEIVGTNGKIVTVEASKNLTETSSKWLESKGIIKVVTGIGFPVWQVPPQFENFDFIDDGNSLGGNVVFYEKSKPKIIHEIYDIQRIEKEFNLQTSVLVIDIEGTEIVFLDESISIPQNIKNIVIEMHPNMYGFDKEKQILNKLNQLGFKTAKEISHVFLLTR